MDRWPEYFFFMTGLLWFLDALFIRLVYHAPPQAFRIKTALSIAAAAKVYGDANAIGGYI